MPFLHLAVYNLPLTLVSEIEYLLKDTHSDYEVIFLFGGFVCLVGFWFFNCICYLKSIYNDFQGKANEKTKAGLNLILCRKLVLTKGVIVSKLDF